MIEYFKLIILILGGNAALVLSASWLFQKMISQQLSKDLERYKAELQQLTYKLSKQHDVVILQKYAYYLPFQYAVDEFRRRLSHITTRLSEEGIKHDEMILRFAQDDYPKPLEWYLSDTVGSDGGYFLTSTIYMNCVVFYWMKRIQFEYPYIPLVLGKEGEEAQKNYAAHCHQESYLSVIQEQCNIYDFIKNIKIAIAGKNGIPYGLHDSIGDMLFNRSEQRVVNYFEFCELLMDEKTKLPFLSVINFWKGLIPLTSAEAQERLRKMQILIDIFDLLKSASIPKDSKNQR